VSRVAWLDVWTRAVIVPAWRRAAAVWIGCAIVAAVTFGPNGMKARDLTWLALHHVGVGVVLGVTWLLVFAPTARLLVRAEGAAYLRSLPGPRVTPVVLGAAAFVALQLPWAALWIVGEGALGIVVVIAMSLLLVALAHWRPPVMRATWPGWRRDSVALRAIQLRGLRRRAGDALVRGAGLSILAGGAAGLFVRNNQLVEAGAAAVGASVIAVALVPAQVGVQLVILTTHRSTAWLAASLGTTRAARITAVVYALAVVQLVATAIALVAAALVIDADWRTLAWLAATSMVVAIASALGCARVLLADEDSPTIAARAVVGAVGVAAVSVLALGLFGAAGVLASLAAGVLALSTMRSK
jgi:hypothetical protein